MLLLLLLFHFLLFCMRECLCMILFIHHDLNASPMLDTKNDSVLWITN